MEDGMGKRKLGSTDLELTVIGLGTWAMGGGGWQFAWGPQDDAESIKTIHRALDLGINWIDTAAIYGLGHAEEIVGKALKGMSERPMIATKCSRVWNSEGKIRDSLKRESIKKEVEDSLKRLRVEVIDLYQMHWPMPDEDIEEGWRTFAELLQAGKIRYAGVSNFSIAQLERIKTLLPVTSLQPPYSMIVRNIEAELLEYCAKNEIGVICYSPMYKGLLTGKVTKERIGNLASDDHRRNDPHFQEPELSINLEFIEKLRQIAVQEEKTLAQLAIAWTLRRPEVTAAIVGGRRSNQIEELAVIEDWSLAEETMANIDQLLQERENSILQRKRPTS